MAVRSAGDYRDQLPPSLEAVAAHYAPVVQDGKWTFGLLEMWTHKARVAKSAVHVPCWEAFTWNPFKWRGCCFGRCANLRFILRSCDHQRAIKLIGAGVLDKTCGFTSLYSNDEEAHSSQMKTLSAHCKLWFPHTMSGSISSENVISRRAGAGCMHECRVK